MNCFTERFIEKRKKYIAEEFSRMNSMQVSAILATEGPLLILAGAGSGKTTVLINRVYNLIKFGSASDSDEVPDSVTEKELEMLDKHSKDADAVAALNPVEPWRILAITFTNKAADELKRRLADKIGVSAEDIWACTFHSACVRILRRDADYIGFPKSFTIYDTSDSVSLIKHIIKDLDIDEKMFAPKQVLAEISRSKESEITASQYSDYAFKTFDIRKKKLAAIYSEYSRRMLEAGAMDFDDLLLYTVKLLKDFDEVREYWQRRFKYVLIDEYQDTNHLQYLFATLIAGAHQNICVVGDDDQSIYKFRGATIENILSFEDEYEQCRVIRLEQNYRSTSRILDAANAVISNNQGRKGKTLWTDKGEGELLKLYVAENEAVEAKYVASRIMSEYGRGASFKDFAILYRVNAQSNQFEYAFKRLGIPYKIFGGTKFYDRAEVKDMLAYLCVIQNTSDNLRLSRIINVPPRGIGAKSLENALQISANTGKSLFEIISHADSYPELSRSSVRMIEFSRLINSFRNFSENNTPDFLLEEVFEKTGYLNMLTESNTVEDTARIENIREIKTGMISYAKETQDTTLEGYLANVALYSDIDNLNEDDNNVVLMTMHNAKGLEFPTVFLVGMEENLFPSIKSIGEPEELEEERRLCYVAITRAETNLEIVCARQRMLFGKTTANRVSRFVEEIPEELLERKIPKGSSYSYKTPEVSYYSSIPKKKSPFIHNSNGISSEPKDINSFMVGDRIKHNTFGEGVIVKMTPMGTTDFLVEIEYDNIGTKKMMLRTALQYIDKI